jgi:hypothetical protein
MIDLAAIAEVFGLFRTALGAVKDAKELLPGHQQKVVDETLEKAGIAAAAAEAQLAQELGYQLCKCAWPPRIMIRKQVESGVRGSGKDAFRRESWVCPSCGELIVVRASPYAA